MLNRVNDVILCQSGLVSILPPGVYRRSRLQMFYKIVVLKDFEKLTGKHLYLSLCLRELLAESSQFQHLNFGNFKERIRSTGFAYMKCSQTFAVIFPNRRPSQRFILHWHTLNWCMVLIGYVCIYEINATEINKMILNF